MEGQPIGDQLKAARKLRNIKTTKDLAGKVNKPRFGDKVIGQIERNDRNAQPHEIEWLAEALGVPASYLTETPEAEPDRLEAIEGRLARIEAALDRIEQAVRPGVQIAGVQELLGVLEEARHAESQQTARTGK